MANVNDNMNMTAVFHNVFPKATFGLFWVVYDGQTAAAVKYAPLRDWVTKAVWMVPNADRRWDD